MYGEALLVMLVGCVAFVFGVICLILRLFAWLGRGLWRLSDSTEKPRVCPTDKCGKMEYRSARYCSRCGKPLTRDRVYHV